MNIWESRSIERCKAEGNDNPKNMKVLRDLELAPQSVSKSALSAGLQAA